MLLADLTIDKVAAMLTPLFVIIAAIVNYFTAPRKITDKLEKIEARSEVATDKLEKIEASSEVATEKLEKIEATGEALANGQMGVVLRALAVMSRRYAALTGKRKDLLAAEAAELAAVEYEKRTLAVAQAAEVIAAKAPTAPPTAPEPAPPKDD